MNYKRTAVLCKAHDPWPLIAIIQDLTVSQIIESDDQWFWQIPRNAMLNRCSVHCSYPFRIWKCKWSCLKLHTDLENSGHWLFCATLSSSKWQFDLTSQIITPLFEAALISLMPLMSDMVTKQLIPLGGFDFLLDPAKIPWSNWAYNLLSMVYLPVPHLRWEEIRLLAQ